MNGVKSVAKVFPEANLSVATDVYNLSLPRSACPTCHTQLRVIDNIPVISWLMLSGKCHQCKSKISLRYPLIEMLSAILCLVIALQFGATYFAIALLFFTFVLIAATFIDLDTMFITRSIDTATDVGGY